MLTVTPYRTDILYKIDSPVVASCSRLSSCSSLRNRLAVILAKSLCMLSISNRINNVLNTIPGLQLCDQNKLIVEKIIYKNKRENVPCCDFRGKIEKRVKGASTHLESTKNRVY